MSAFDIAAEWKPPAKIEELFAATAGNKFAAINSPVAGAREDRDLPQGTAPVQLYSLFTPNGLCNWLLTMFATAVITERFVHCFRSEG